MQKLSIIYFEAETPSETPGPRLSKWQKGESKAAELNKKLKERREGDTSQMTKSM